MDTISLWKDTASKPPHFSSFSGSVDTDVVIIGGGITGVITAYQLIKQGKQVIMLDAGLVGDGTTAYSTGNLYLPVQPYLQNIVSKFNLETAKAVVDSRTFALNLIEAIIKEVNIDCRFAHRPWYLYATEDKEIKQFDREAAVFSQIGLDAKTVQTLPIPVKFKKALVLKDQARFNPYQFVIKLADYLAKAGCQIFENSRVLEYAEEKEHCTVKTKDGTIRAKQVIIATHTPIGINPVQMFTAPYRSYVMAVTLKNNDYPEGHFWDLSDPHHATCTHPWKSDALGLLMVAGSHHKTGQEKNAKSHFGALKAYLENHYDVAETAYQWSAQHYQAADDIPYIGLAHRGAKRTLMATGYFADGLVYGALAAAILSEAISGNENIWREIYNATRVKLVASLPSLLKENANVFAQYLKDYTFGEHESLNEIKNEEGAIVKIAGEKCAVYRDQHNKLHAVSAVCTHMKGIVHWNNAEKSWDCPCHGSRFDTAGNVLEGPATKNLEKKTVA
ncbi:MAG: FAD-dependent oxidoreductase [Gammaproteobacteria bacterium]|nr:FAD-dependent oxidoreductase [Gammaproteobacteria bacterium]